MKRVVLISIFIMLCLCLLVFKGGIHAQQKTTQMDLSKIFDSRLLFHFPPNPFSPPFYPMTQWPTLQPITMPLPTIPIMPNYSFLFGNSWYLWQIYGFPPLLFSSSHGKDKPPPSNEDTILKFSMKTDKSIYDKAELVKITLTLENKSSEEAIIDFPSEQKFDVIIKHKGGEIVRQLSSDIQYARPSTTLTLQPNETETFYVRWDQEDDGNMIVPSGTYTVKATLTATDEKYKQTISATISVESLPRYSSCEKLKKVLKGFWEDDTVLSITETAEEGDDGEGGGSDYPPDGPIYPPGPVTPPFYGGYGGGYGAAFYDFAAPSYQLFGFGTQRAPSIGAMLAPSYFGQAFAPITTWEVNALAPTYGLGAFAPGISVGFGPIAPSFGGAYSNFSAGFPIGYSNFGGSYNTLPIRWRTALVGLNEDSGSNGHEYSTTNVQVVGVDEADMVKNDEAYIYMIKGKTIQIMEGSPADTMEVVNEIGFEQYADFDPKHLYVKGDLLIVIGDRSLPSEPYYEISIPGTRIFIYDIAERAQEILERKFIFWGGGYVQSRRVGDTLYIIMNEAAPLKRFEGELSDLRALLPHFYDSFLHDDNENDDEILCDCDEVAYMPEYLSPNYLVVIGIPLDDHTKEIGREVILGKSNHVYATSENLYVTSENEDDDKTVVYKFWLDGETIVYGSNGQVPGRIINQFSVDEYEDHLRIATTSESGSQSENSIYIFDSGMKETGSLEDFTPDGSINLIRFMDDRCYAVISGDIYAISLTDPTDPASIGVLDIAGDTYYLHPFNEYRILGFGREEIEGSNEDVMKISLFDVIDLNNPRQIGEDDTIGSGFTESDVLMDHRALLLSTERNLMAFPLTVIEDNGFPQYTFQGAHVYYIDENGFERIESIMHHPYGTFPSDSYEDSSQYHIRRIIYMGDHYYTISESGIIASDMPAG